MSRRSYHQLRKGLLVADSIIRPPSVIRVWRIAMCLLLSVTVGVGARAQGGRTLVGGINLDPSGDATVVDAQGRVLETQDLINALTGGQGEERVEQRSIFESMNKITLGPSTITIDPTSHTATFHLVNPGYDSIPIGFVVRRAGSRQSGSLARWIRNIPPRMILAPGESRTVMLHVAVPEDTPAGTYTAIVFVYYKPTIRVDASTDLSGNVVPRFFADTTVDGFPRRSYVRTELVYTVPKASIQHGRKTLSHNP